MKTFALLAVIIISLAACKKDKDLRTYILAGGGQGETGVHYKEAHDTIKIRDYPEVLITSEPFDINGDKKIDFHLRYVVSTPYMLGATYSSLYIIPEPGNSVCAFPDNPEIADSLHLNDTINASLNWSDSTCLVWGFSWIYSEHSVITGCFYRNDANYMAVRVSKDDEYLFGWVDVSGTVVRRFACTEKY